jgi:hypothetical protein
MLSVGAIKRIVCIKQLIDEYRLTSLHPLGSQSPAVTVSTAVPPAAAAQQHDEKNHDQKRGWYPCLTPVEVRFVFPPTVAIAHLFHRTETP